MLCPILTLLDNAAPFEHFEKPCAFKASAHITTQQQFSVDHAWDECNTGYVCHTEQGTCHQWDQMVSGVVRKELENVALPYPPHVC